MKQQLQQTLASAAEHVAAQSLDQEVELPEFTVERPPNPEFGDYSTNVAMVLPKLLKRPPREIAQAISTALSEACPDYEKVEVAGPGFINVTLAHERLQSVVRSVLAEEEAYGCTAVNAGQKIQVEFVSANPNGPIHLGHGRGAAIGDVLAGVLAATGAEVEREFYINNAGEQMRKFGRSIEIRYRQLLGEQVELPEDAYHGEYIREVAQKLLDAEGEAPRALDEESRVERFARKGEELMLAEQQETLRRFGIEFDVWFGERSLHESGKLGAALTALREGGHTYEQDGALWFRSTDFGDDKDRVVVRGDGRPTYLASDVAYHLDKFERGFDKVIDLWGPDHHGYMARTKGAVSGAGGPGDKLDILVYQIVRLFSGGKLVRMSKRGGELIPLDEVIDDVTADVARFFFLMRSHDSHLDFDLDLAKRESSDNPVYYVQYAHARVCSILREAESRQIGLESADLSLLTATAEIILIRKIADLPEEIQLAAARYEPHRLTRYALDLAAALHHFYTECRVLGDDEDLTRARLCLVKAAGIALGNVLTLLGLTAPERM